jgi:ParB/RepB/Spo0J family partition protein
VGEEVALADIDVTDLEFQYRFPSNISALRSSLESEGQREPIDLVGTRPPYRIVDGFRRVLAATALRWPTVKAFVHRRLSADDAYRIAFTKNVVGRNLSPIERAQAMLLAMQKRGLKEPELGQAFGISRKQVRRYLDLLTLSEPLQRILDGDVVTMAHAKTLAAYGIVNDANEWRTRIRNEKLDARTLARLLAKEKGKIRGAGRPKVYMRREGNAVRMYPFTIGKDSPKAEREAVVRLLQGAIDLLKA